MNEVWHKIQDMGWSVKEYIVTCHREKALNYTFFFSTSGRAFENKSFFPSCRKILECRTERQVNIKFLLKLKKSATKCLQLLTEAYGEECMSCTWFWIVQTNFREVREGVKSYDRRDHPCTVVVNDSLQESVRYVSKIEDRAVAEKL